MRNRWETNGSFLYSRDFMDNRKQIFLDRLNTLSVQEIQRIKDNIDIICFDTLNYNAEENTFCPLAVAMNLHKSIGNPTDEKIQSEIGKRFQPVNALKGVKGTFYTSDRKKDLLEVCDEVIVKGKP